MGQIIRFPSSSHPSHAVTPATGLPPGTDRACAGHALRTALLAAQGADVALGPLLGLGWPMQRIRGLGAASLAAPRHAAPAPAQPADSPSLRLDSGRRCDRW
jgi:hypothetical protein